MSSAKFASLQGRRGPQHQRNVYRRGLPVAESAAEGFQVNLCECGCGGLCKSRFVRGHQIRMRLQDPEWRAARRAANTAANRKRSQDPEWRTAVASPEHIERMSKSVSAVLADPEVKQRHIAATREAFQRPEVKTAMRGPREPLPEETIVNLYKQGWLLCEIARKVGAGFRPNSGAPRLTRIRNVLKRAGVYPRGARKFKLRWVTRDDRKRKITNPRGEWQLETVARYRDRAAMEAAGLKLPPAEDWNTFMPRTSSAAYTVLVYKHGRAPVSVVLQSLAAAGINEDDVLLGRRGLPPELGPLFDEVSAGKD
jgi:hypothetical protein